MDAFQFLRIKDIIRETPQAVSLVFEVPSVLKDNYKFKAGQYLTFKMMLNGEEIRRSYSLCSTPKSGELKVTVKEVEDGTFNMQANFTAMTVDISAQTANKFFTGSNLPINFANGKFQGAGTIGIKSVNSATSTVVGYFAGNQAEGVHGATYQDAAVVGAMAGVFYGSR